MKQLLTTLLFLLLPSLLWAANYYTTNFPLTENPISENRKWINGKDVGIDWANVRTTPGRAYGTEMDKVKYDDSTAILAGTWGPDQVVQAQVHTVNQDSSMFEEVELRVRTSISQHRITGYEINFRCVADGAQYVQIVRWNGPFGNFTYLANVKGPGLHNSDTVKASITGDILTVYINGAQVIQAADNKFSAGSPGMGYYIEGGSASQQGDYGFTSFSASDIPGLGAVSQSSTFDGWQARISKAFRIVRQHFQAWPLLQKTLWFGKGGPTVRRQCSNSTWVLAALCESSVARAIARIVSEVLTASAIPYLKMASDRI
jgi:hypothetical protein